MTFRTISRSAQRVFGRTLTLMVSTELAIPAGVRTRDWPRAQQCSTVKDNGVRCRRRALRGGRVCYVHGGQLPSVRAAAEAEVTELRTRALSIADRALDVVEDALEDMDPNVRLRASQMLLDRVLPRQQPAVSVTVGIGEPADSMRALSPSEVIRERLRQLQEPTRALLAGEPVLEPEDGEALESEVLDGGPLDHTASDLDDGWR
jgi:hypothetical protein